MNLILEECRVCKGQKTYKHSVTSSLPVYIWPLPQAKENLFLDAGLFICDDCSHVQLQSLDDTLINSFYEDEYFVLEDNVLDLDRVDLLVSVFGKEMLGGAKFLDIGGGNNPFAEPLSVRGVSSESWVVDINPKPSAAEKATQIVTGRFEHVPLPNGYFNFVTSFLSMEHFNYPPAVVARMAEVLQPGGLAVIEVPNLTGLIDLIPHYLVFHQHVSIFSIGALDSLFSLHGFRRQTILREDHSIMVAYENVHAPRKLCVPTIDPKAELDRFRSRMRKIDEDLKKLNFTSKLGGLGLYSAGGSSSLFLANFPWLREYLSLVFDRDERKQGRIVPGTDLVILPPEKIKSSGIDKLLFIDSAIYDNVAPGLSIDCVNLSPYLVASVDHRKGNSHSLK